jgi:hypothetical protein
VLGFSASNISRMRAFFLAYAPRRENSAQAVPNLHCRGSSRHLATTSFESPPEPVAAIPWGHNVLLLFKLSALPARLWYARQATKNGWSRSALEHWIESDLYARQGKAITNFETSLPRAQSDLAKDSLPSPSQIEAELESK